VREGWLASLEAGDGVLTGARDLVSSSWSRVRDLGLDHKKVTPPVIPDSRDLRTRRDTHPLAAVLPTARRLLLDDLGVPVLMAISDVDGTLMWVEGDAGLRRAGEGIAFMEGATWTEDTAGTNAFGTALALGRPVRVHQGEHYWSDITGWSCSAAPVHDPVTGELLGIMDLSGGEDLGHERALEYVRAAVAAIEGELRVAAIRRRIAPGVLGTGVLAPPAAPRLNVMGPLPTLEHGGTMHPISLRHSEILLLLANGPEGGRSAAQLATELDDGELAPVTVRAEVHRLRSALTRRAHGTLDLSAAPYRLQGALSCDVLELRDALRAGRVRHAVRAWTGEVLPGSDAPGVRELRAELAGELRASVLEGEDDAALLEYSRSPAGRTDVVVARDLVRRLAPGDAGRAEAVARMELLRV